jgi:hypothetical protein
MHTLRLSITAATRGKVQKLLKLRSSLVSVHTVMIGCGHDNLWVTRRPTLPVNYLDAHQEQCISGQKQQLLLLKAALTC